MRPLSALVVAVFVLTRVAHGLSSSLAPVEAFVSTSQDVNMFVYRPDIATPADTQAIVVAIHSCERTAEYYFQNTGYAALADQYGYIVIYPNASTPSGCWDTSTSASLTRNGGGDSQAIANMVTYAVENLNGNANRVAVTGSSSGGIMVNLLAGIYPDIFQAASVFSGKYANSIWPYSGSRPKMMIYHGTIDATYNYSNLNNELTGWSSVLNVTFSDNVTNTPSPGYTKMVYGDGSKLVGVSAAGVGHTVPVDAVTDLAWFCIAPACAEASLPVVSTTSSSSSSSSTGSTTSSSSTTSTSSSATSGEATPTSASSATSTAASNRVASETSTSTSPLVTESTAAHSKLSSGAKAGISVAVIALVLLFCATGVFLLRKRRRTRSSEPEIENSIMSLKPGHEYHSGYGVAPVRDSIQIGDNTEKLQKQMYPEPTSKTGLLARSQGERYRDSTASTLVSPQSPTADQRYSTESSTMLPPPSFREDQRFSATSLTMLLPHSSAEYQRNSNASIKLVPHSEEGEEEQDISDTSYRA